MPVDPGNIYIDYYDGNDANNDPDGSESRKQGDDHLRGIKGTLARSFTAIAGAVTVDQDELNTLDGINTGLTVESRLTALEETIPAGTDMVFYQAAAPSAQWVQRVDLNDYMLRIVNSSGGGSGGSDTPISMSGPQVPQHTHGATSSDDGGHSHDIYESTIATGTENAFADDAALTGRQVAQSSGYIVAVLDHNHTITVSDNSGPSSWTPRYIDVIICEKQ